MGTLGYFLNSGCFDLSRARLSITTCHPVLWNLINKSKLIGDVATSCVSVHAHLLHFHLRIHLSPHEDAWKRTRPAGLIYGDEGWFPTGTDIKMADGFLWPCTANGEFYEQHFFCFFTTLGKNVSPGSLLVKGEKRPTNQERTRRARGHSCLITRAT